MEELLEGVKDTVEHATAYQVEKDEAAMAQEEGDDKEIVTSPTLAKSLDRQNSL